jgi:hypothetical protein|tara:strand:+ start:143 stop:868 length:726 start_codon:yes stop_codon:yes gene_type:complete
MKNVYVYNIVADKRRYDDELLFNYFKAQVDNSLRFGWDRKDIVIGTNFTFEHNGVNNIHLENICETNIFNNKWYGISELMEMGYLDDDFWFHDQDSWQVNKIEFPEFQGQIGGCTYVYTPEWNTCSMFLKKSSENIVDYIVEFMDMNENQNFYSDENFIALLRQNSEISNELTTINNKFNVGLTHMEKRYQAAEKPVCALGFQPHVQSSWDVFIEGKNELKLKLIDTEMIELFKKYNLVPE